jgi:hypothetical protein
MTSTPHNPTSRPTQTMSDTPAGSDDVAQASRRHLSVVPIDQSLPPSDRTDGLCAAFGLLGVRSLARGPRCLAHVNGHLVIAERAHGEIEVLIACDGHEERRRWWAPLTGAVTIESVARALLPLVDLLENTPSDELPVIAPSMADDRLQGLLRRESERCRLDRRRALQIAYRCWASNPDRHPGFDTSGERLAALRFLRGIDSFDLGKKAVHR